VRKQIGLVALLLLAGCGGGTEQVNQAQGNDAPPRLLRSIVPAPRPRPTIA
jgi:hypothetical protein